MRLELFEEAASEIEGDRAWYRRRSESAEAGFLRELDHAIQQVADAPAQWPRYLAGTRRYSESSLPRMTGDDPATGENACAKPADSTSLLALDEPNPPLYPFNAAFTLSAVIGSR